MRGIWHKIRTTMFMAYRPWMLAYSFISAAILLFVIWGIDAVASTPLFSTGNAAAASGNFRYFFMSWHGYVLVTASCALLILAAATILNGALILLNDIRDNLRKSANTEGEGIVKKAERLFGLFARGFLSIRLFLRREDISLVIQFVLFIPLAAVAVFFIIPDPFEIPGLIRYLIQKKLLYKVIYAVLLATLSLMQLRNLFIIREILTTAGRKSGVKKYCSKHSYNGREYIHERVHRALKTNIKMTSVGLIRALGSASVIIFGGWAAFMYMPYLFQRLRYVMPRMTVRFIVLIGIWNGLLVFALSLFIAPWVFLTLFTALAGRIHDGTGTSSEASVEECRAHEEPDAENTGKKRRIILSASVCLAIAVILSAVSYIHFDEWFPRARNIEAVVHRLGGDIDAENTLEGQEAAIEAGATAAETDIQRTKDGEYIVFHDGTLKRMCGVNERPCDLTLAQIREMTVTNADGEERRIPTLKEVLEKARGRETLYLELKGVTVDKKMADDVINMVREMGMLEDCVIISMNYSVISYVYNEHPEIRCGYLSYFTYGSSSKLDGNILLSLSNAVTPAKTSALHRMGKRLYAWTVNTRSQARRMLRLNVDGIISDRYDIIQSVLDHMESRSDCERIMDVLRS